MECSCEIEVDHSSAPKVYVEVTRKANKEHKCGECCRTINKGENYEHVRGLWDFGWETYKTCNDCLSMRKEFFTRYLFCELWDYFYEYVSDCGGDIPESCLTNLTTDARNKAIKILEEYQSD